LDRCPSSGRSTPAADRHSCSAKSLRPSGSRPASVPLAVACYIVAAYWFTVSTSFANPAVTLARCMTDTFTGIRPADVPAFIAAQLAGGALAAPLFAWMLPLADRRSEHWDLASEKE
jgi:glycerol uptake facilitator-like aquaporin